MGHRGYEREGRAEGLGGGAGRVQQTGRAGMGTALEMRVLGWGPGGRRVPFRRGPQRVRGLFLGALR